MVEKVDEKFQLDDEDVIDMLDGLNVKESDNGIIMNKKNEEDDDQEPLDQEEDTYTIRMFGLDGAGKTTIFSNLVTNAITEETDPTEDFGMDIIKINDLSVSLWDISGAKSYQDCWRNYFSSTDAFIYVVDISSPDRFEESKKALKDHILSDEDNLEIPTLIIANKSDKSKTEYKEADIFKVLAIPSRDNYKGVLCSAKKEGDKGLKEGINWIYQKIKRE